MAVKRDFDTMLSVALVVALVFGGAMMLRRHTPGSGNKAAAPSTAAGPAVTALPDAYFTDAIGQHRTLADFRGKVVLVNLWATWCPPCVTEMPSLDKLQAKLQDKDFKVLAVSMDPPPLAKVTAFLEQKDITHLEPYWDQDKQIPMKWKYAGLPVSFLLDRDGRVVQQFDGPQVWDSGPVFEKISALLK